MSSPVVAADRVATATAFHVVVPARLGSTRLPRKVLLPLAGKPVVQWVWEAAQTASAASVTVAADTEEVAEVCRGFGASVCMTRAEHPSGTDRAEEVATRLGWPDDAIVVNLQGDEPLMPPALVAQVATLLADDPDAQLATLAHAIHDPADFANPNVVKVVADGRGRALYFSRAPIPFPRDASIAAAAMAPVGAATPAVLPPAGMALRHIGLYAYRVGALRAFSRLPAAALEQCEALEQLRALHAGMAIRLGLTDAAPPRGVDTAADLEALAAVMAGR